MKQNPLPHRIRRSAALGLLLPGLLLAIPGCRESGAGPAAAGPGSEAFIAAYVDLRTEAIRSGVSELAPEVRAAVLARHGVTEEDLFAFVEAHGRDVAYMRSVWDEVERRLDGVRVDGSPSPGEETGEPALDGAGEPGAGASSAASGPEGEPPPRPRRPGPGGGAAR